MTRHLGKARQNPRLLKPAPAIQADEGRHEPGPRRGPENGEPEKAHGPHEADEGGGGQTARPSQRKPEERSEDLTAVQRIDGQDVEDEESEIHEGHSADEPARIWKGRG